MATIVTKDGIMNISDKEPKVQAYNALKIAAERIGKNNFARGEYKVFRIRQKIQRGYRITQAHEDVILAMALVLSEKISPDAAMNLLQRSDVLEQRLWKNN